jgi:4-hydroxy-tetrahydrodipicolinate reductase
VSALPERTPMRVVVAGAAGRMGRTLIEALRDDPRLALAGALEAPGNPAIGMDAGEFLGVRTGIRITADADAALSVGTCIIEFTRPSATIEHLAAALRQRAAMVIGTTGFSEAEKAQLRAAASEIPIVLAPNMAVGVNALFSLAATVASILGDDYDVEIIEAHHRHKVDAPSGTALRLGEIVAAALGRDLNRVARHGRHGETGERDRATIGFHAIRGGDIVGEHTLIFAGSGERLELTIRSSSRLTYALGALRAARFLKDKSNGMFDMQDVLGLGGRASRVAPPVDPPTAS